MEVDTLDYIIYSKQITESDSDDINVVGMTRNLTSQDAAVWRGLVSVEPTLEQPAVGIFHGPESDFLLVRADHQQPGHIIYQYTRLPRHVLQMMSGNLRQLVETTQRYPNGNTLAAIEIPPQPTWIPGQRSAVLQQLIERYDAQVLFSLLAAALDERKLLIRGFEPAADKRLELIQGLLLLLPSTMRPFLTFATSVKSPAQIQGRVIFNDNKQDATRWVVDMQNASAAVIPSSPYVELLQARWNGDFDAFIADLRGLELIGAQFGQELYLTQGLTETTHRFMLNQRVLSGEAVSGEELKAILSDADSLTDDTLQPYTERLLDYCLNERDAEAVNILAPFIDREDAVGDALRNTLMNALNDAPDAVYFFIRTFLATNPDAYDSWLSHLHAAAVVALQIAINDGDNETLMSWLRLIAREPVSYQLAQVLKNGILAARQRAYEDGELGSRLLVFASKRTPNLIDTLLNDDKLVNRLASPLGPALTTHEADAMLESFQLGEEISLILLAQTIATAPAALQPQHIYHLWHMTTYEGQDGLPEHYRPLNLVDKLIEDKLAHLSRESLEALLISAIETTRFHQLIATVPHDRFNLLISVYEQAQASAERVLTLTQQLLEDETLTAQQTIDIYVQIASRRRWQRDTLLLVEQIARSIQREQDLSISSDVLWHMFNLVTEAESELAARNISRRLLAHAEGLQNEGEPITTLNRLEERLRWSSSARAYVINWLRGYTRHQSLTRLQQLRKSLEGKRNLEEAQSIVDTAIAFRKMLGNRSLEDFTAAISIAYSVLQAISESFDPVNKQPINFDAATIRGELEIQNPQLPPEERSIVSKNMRELAQIIITMSDHRRKATLIRSEENIERQLYTGEQRPQSAIDTLKWLSGYLSGAQDKDDNGS